MKQILKRLELIKIAIDIGDEYIIEIQFKKLVSLEVDNKIDDILLKIANKDYGSVIVDIDNYLKEYSGLVLYVDQEVQGLKLELKALEKGLQHLSEIKNEYLTEIEEFNTMYSLRVGGIIEKILKLKEQILQQAIKFKQDLFKDEKEKHEDIKDEVNTLKVEKAELEDRLEELDEFDDEYDEVYREYQDIKCELDEKEEELQSQRKKAKEAKEELEDDPVNDQYEEAKNDYKEFSSDYEDTIKKEEQKYNLSEDEKKELKKIYRKASRMCHPDIVADELKVQATEIMKQLNDAYDNKDIEKVKEILKSLENGTSFDVASDKIDDKKILKSKIEEFREKISIIEQELDEIKEDEIFQTIQDIEDMDVYFEDLKEQLLKEYKLLKDEEKNIYQDSETKELYDIESLFEDNEAHQYFANLREKIEKGYQEEKDEERVEKNSSDYYWNEEF